jgi:transcription-repair coupling factor (superfamily II helicase)
LYNELGDVKNEEELTVFRRLITVLVQCPHRAKVLMNSIRIKWIATMVGIEKLVMKQGKMIAILSERTTDYYQSNRFQKQYCKSRSICK